MTNSGKVRVTQIKSGIAADIRVRRCLKALGLGRIGKSKDLNSNACVLGMVRKVEHLVNCSVIK